VFFALKMGNALMVPAIDFLGNQCQYSFASYFSGNYGIYDAEVDSIIDTILINNVNNSTDNNISIKNYANLNDDLEILATVQNDSVIDIFEQTATFENEDSIEQEVIVSGSILGKPTDTLMLTSIYTYNNKDSIYNKKLLKLEN